MPVLNPEQKILFEEGLVQDYGPNLEKLEEILADKTARVPDELSRKMTQIDQDQAAGISRYFEIHFPFRRLYESS